MRPDLSDGSSASGGVGEELGKDWIERPEGWWRIRSCGLGASDSIVEEEAARADGHGFGFVVARVEGEDHRESLAWINTLSFYSRNHKPKPMAICSRRLLLHYRITSPKAASGESSPSSTTFHTVIMIVAVLLTLLICALGLNVITSYLFQLFGRSSQSFPIVLPGTAARRRAIRKVPFAFFSPDLRLASSGSECAICLTEIEPGDQIRLLPVCRHGFHVHCIDPWLLTRPTCPSCRQCPFATSPKSSGDIEPEEVDRTGIEPLGPEGLEIPYRL
ncbi:hypothetical protein M5K25_020672 [Dendrobium thyrsiflorum]|uniref:RING-type domain-containing protein n=1 Tax=Dendrobium thyrsiflorum TaxID=117978 RepID=A0ABD0UAK9_DENTH